MIKILLSSEFRINMINQKYELILKYPLLIESESEKNFNFSQVRHLPKNSTCTLFYGNDIIFIQTITKSYQSDGFDRISILLRYVLCIYQINFLPHFIQSFWWQFTSHIGFSLSISHLTINFTIKNVQFSEFRPQWISHYVDIQ